MQRMHRLHLHNLHRHQRFQRLGHIADPVAVFARGMKGRARWHRDRAVRAARREPSTLKLLLAGLAVLTLARVMSAATNRRRSLFGQLTLAALTALLASIVTSFRRSNR